MSKFTCLVLCIVAASFSKVHAAKDLTLAIEEFLTIPLLECAKEQGISQEEFIKAKETRSSDVLDSCFFSCIYKKAGLINSKGEFDADTGISKIKSFVDDDALYTKLVNMGKKCISVNDKPSSDGDAGCERAILLMECFQEHESKLDS